MLSNWFIYLSRFTFAVATIVTFCLSVVRIDQSLPGGLSDKFYHALAFFVLSFLSNASFPESAFSYKKGLPLFFYGVLIETVQYFLPYRSFSIGDMVADAVGIFVYFLIVKLLFFFGFFHAIKNN